MQIKRVKKNVNIDNVSLQLWHQMNNKKKTTNKKLCGNC